MNKVLNKRELAPNVFLMEIQAPRIAKTCLPGQFVIVRMDEKSERIPLAIYDYDAKKGTVTVVLQVLGKLMQKIADCNESQVFKDFIGPLGQRSVLAFENSEYLIAFEEELKKISANLYIGTDGGNHEYKKFAKDLIIRLI